MTLVRFLILLALAGGVYQYWKEHRAETAGSSASASVTSENGFVGLPPVAAQNADGVLVIAAENCPHDDAQRADRLADDLRRKGIPAVRIHQVSFDLSAPDDSAVQRITTIMNGRLPIVFVRGRAKSDPTLAEVVAEYQSPDR